VKLLMVIFLTLNCLLWCSLFAALGLMHAQNPVHSSSSSLSSENSCQKSSEVRKVSMTAQRHRKKSADCKRYSLCHVCVMTVSEPNPRSTAFYNQPIKKLQFLWNANQKSSSSSSSWSLIKSWHTQLKQCKKIRR